jgi:gamma-glutamyltranspeptidase/glutathione hydrolase
VVDGAGFFMNNEMDDFATFPTDTRSDWIRNGIVPDKTPLSSMSPQIVLRPDNSLFLMTGTPGGNTIINTNLHCIINAVDHGMNVSEMAAAPRTHHQWKNNDGLSESPLQYETMFGFTNDTIQALRDMGYPLSTGNLGTVCAIMVDSSGNATGSHDPRSFDDPPAFNYQKLVEWVNANKK